MPIPEQRDRPESRRKLGEWLATKVPADDGVTVADFDGPGATGFSNETLITTASWQENGEPRSRDIVVRVAPTGYHLFPDPAFEAQYRVLKTLAERTDIPVPAIHWYEPDPAVLGAPFFVMGKIDGRAPSDMPPYHSEGWLVDATPAQREAVWWGGIDTIAAVHRLDWRGLGLDFLDHPELGKPGLEQTVRYYEKFLAWVEESEPLPVGRRALDWIGANLPVDEQLVLCWGDARIGNILFDGDCRPAAVLDWEMACLGSPAQDVAWALFLDRHHCEGIGVPRLAGFPSREATIARYEQRSGIRLANMEFYEIFAAFRFTVIMGRLGVIFKDWGLIPPDDPMVQENTAAKLTAKLLGDLAPV